MEKPTVVKAEVNHTTAEDMTIVIEWSDGSQTIVVVEFETPTLGSVSHMPAE